MLFHHASNASRLASALTIRPQSVTDTRHQQNQAANTMADEAPHLAIISVGSGGRADKTPMIPVTVGFQSFSRCIVSNRMGVIAHVLVLLVLS